MTAPAEEALKLQTGALEVSFWDPMTVEQLTAY